MSDPQESTIRTVERATTYAASDGTEFDDPETAKRYEKMIAARRDFKTARKHYARTLAKSYVTADGKPFDFGTWKSYYRISPRYDEVPTVEELDIWQPDFDFDSWGGVDDPDTEIAFRCKVYRINEPVLVRISDLYASRAAAERACVKARREWIANLIRETDEMEAKLP